MTECYAYVALFEEATNSLGLGRYYAHHVCSLCLLLTELSPSSVPADRATSIKISFARRHRVAARGRIGNTCGLWKRTIAFVCVALVLSRKSWLVRHGSFSIQQCTMQ